MLVLVDFMSVFLYSNVRNYSFNLFVDFIKIRGPPVSNTFYAGDVVQRLRKKVMVQECGGREALEITSSLKMIWMYTGRLHTVLVLCIVVALEPSPR